MPKSLFVIDPWTAIAQEKDTSLALMLEAQKRGFNVLTCHMQGLYLKENEVFAKVECVHLAEDCSHKILSTKTESLKDIDVVWMRKDPPVDEAYLYTTMLLNIAKKNGTPVLNDPQSLATLNEKIMATHFLKWTPDTLISADVNMLKLFIEEHQEVVTKPLNGMGGKQIFKCESHHVNTQVILETLTQNGQQLALVQRYIPEIASGDKRILSIHGNAYQYALVRKPPKDDFRGNLSAGGKGEVAKLTEEEQALCEDLNPFLIKNGILFAGIDVIGGHLTEINITSPTCLREIQAQTGENIAAFIWDACERHYLK